MRKFVGIFRSQVHWLVVLGGESVSHAVNEPTFGRFQLNENYDLLQVIQKPYAP